MVSSLQEECQVRLGWPSRLFSSKGGDLKREKGLSKENRVTARELLNKGGHQIKDLSEAENAHLSLGTPKAHL
jgi:hypothetical protein